MIVKTSIGFLGRDSAMALTTRVDIILEAMNVAKATFANPSPTLADVRAANDALKVAINESADGSREMSAVKRAKQTEVIALTRLLASYVTVTANGDMAKLLSSGFPYQKPTRSRVGELPEPSTPVVKQGTLTGQAICVTTPVYGAASYNWRAARASAPTVYVQTLQSTGARTTLEGLTPGELYNVEVNAVGSAGPSNWSVPGQLRVI